MKSLISIRGMPEMQKPWAREELRKDINFSAVSSGVVANESLTHDLHNLSQHTAPHADQHESTAVGSD